MAIRKAQPTTVTSAAPAITRFSCSISSATWSGAVYGLATCIAPTAGATCWSRLSPGIGIGSCGATSVAMPPSPHRTCMSSWKPKATPTPSVSKPTRFCRRASPICSPVPSVVRQAMFAASMPASAIGQARGTGSAGSSPRWSGRGTGSPGRLHRHQSGPARRTRGGLLQPAGHGGAVHPVDAPLVPEVPQQHGPASASRPGLPTSATSCGRWPCRRRWSTGL